MMSTAATRRGVPMTTRVFVRAIRLAVLPVILAASVQAQSPPAPSRSMYDRYTEPIQIYKTGLGSFTKPISSPDKQAQAFFDQGFQMMYSFAKPEAVRSF